MSTDPSRAQWVPDEPHADHGWTTQQIENPQHAPSHKGRTVAIVAVCAVAVAGVVAAVSLWTSGGDNKAGNIQAVDSGVSACRLLAASYANPDDDQTTTTAQDVAILKAWRAEFAGSKFADIRKPGVDFIDTITPIAAMGDSDAAGLAALGSITKLSTDITALNAGCSAHGVNGVPTAETLFSGDDTQGA